MRRKIDPKINQRVKAMSHLLSKIVQDNILKDYFIGYNIEKDILFAVGLFNDKYEPDIEYTKVQSGQLYTARRSLLFATQEKMARYVRNIFGSESPEPYVYSDYQDNPNDKAHCYKEHKGKVKAANDRFMLFGAGRKKKLNEQVDHEQIRKEAAIINGYITKQYKDKGISVDHVVYIRPHQGIVRVRILFTDGVETVKEEDKIETFLTKGMKLQCRLFVYSYGPNFYRKAEDYYRDKGQIGNTPNMEIISEQEEVAEPESPQVDNSQERTKAVNVAKAIHKFILRQYKSKGMIRDCFVALATEGWNPLTPYLCVYFNDKYFDDKELFYPKSVFIANFKLELIQLLDRYFTKGQVRVNIYSKYTVGEDKYLRPRVYKQHKESVRNMGEKSIMIEGFERPDNLKEAIRQAKLVRKVANTLFKPKAKDILVYVWRSSEHVPIIYVDVLMDPEHDSADKFITNGDIERMVMRYTSVKVVGSSFSMFSREYRPDDFYEQNFEEMDDIFLIKDDEPQDLQEQSENPNEQELKQIKDKLRVIEKYVAKDPSVVESFVYAYYATSIERFVYRVNMLCEYRNIKLGDKLKNIMRRYLGIHPDNISITIATLDKREFFDYNIETAKVKIAGGEWIVADRKD